MMFQMQIKIHKYTGIQSPTGGALDIIYHTIITVWYLYIIWYDINIYIYTDNMYSIYIYIYIMSYIMYTLSYINIIYKYHIVSYRHISYIIYQAPKAWRCAKLVELEPQPGASEGPVLNIMIVIMKNSLLANLIMTICSGSWWWCWWWWCWWSRITIINVNKSDRKTVVLDDIDHDP